LREEPKEFHDRYRSKLDLLECDFVVMPMFAEGGRFFFKEQFLIEFFIVRNHWRLGIIENPGKFMEGKT